MNQNHGHASSVNPARVPQLGALGSLDASRSVAPRRLAAFPPPALSEPESEAEKTRRIELAIRMAEEERQKMQDDVGVPPIIPPMSSSSSPTFASFPPVKSPLAGLAIPSLSAAALPGSYDLSDPYDLARKGKKPRALRPKSDGPPIPSLPLPATPPPPSALSQSVQSMGGSPSFSGDSPKLRRRARKNSRSVNEGLNLTISSNDFVVFLTMIERAKFERLQFYPKLFPLSERYVRKIKDFDRNT